MNAPTLIQQDDNVWFRVIPSLGIDMMTLLFNRLDGAYPNVFRANFKSMEAIANWRETWAEAFDDEGLTPDGIKAGLKQCRRNHDMPPSLTQFIKACNPEMVLDIEALFHRAVSEMRKRRLREEQNWTSPAVFWAAAKIGDDLFRTDYRDLKGRWAAALDEMRSRTDAIPDVAAREALPPPLPAMSREESARRISQLGAGKIGSGGAGMKWARDIAANPKAYPLVSQRYAFEALTNMRLDVPEALDALFRAEEAAA